MEKKIKLADIRIDGGTQSRVKLDMAYVKELAESIRDMPWMLVYFDGSEYWLADGFHRYHACKAAGVDIVPVKMEKGTQRDAMLKSAGANASHGLRRTNEDKHKAVSMLLNDEEWGKKSANWIAQRCAVSVNLVIDLKSTLGKESASVETSDGRKMNTANIGRKAKASAPKPAPEPLEDGCSDAVEPVEPPQAVEPVKAKSATVVEGPLWSIFLNEIEGIKSDARSLSAKLSRLLAFENKRPTNQWAHYMSYDGTAGALNALIRYLDDYSPAGPSDRPPGYIPGHSAELRKGAA